MDLLIDSVTKYYGNVTAVNDVSLKAPEGEFTVLLGPSGCGKTTLLRLVAGLERPDAGTVCMGGRDITHLEPRDRDIAMVFQSYALYPHLSIAGNIGYPLKIRKRLRPEIKTEVSRVAEKLGLEALLDRRPRELSGGQRQRVALARAIVRQPKAFLMDEPLSNLDAKLRVETRFELKRLQRELNTVTLYVTHDQTEAMTLADRIAVINHGRLLQYDTPSNIYHRPVNMFVAGFLGSPSMNLVKGALEAGRFVGRGLLVELGPELSAALGNHSQVTLGVRPEDVEVSIVEQPGWQAARVYVAEEMGNETLVRLSVDSLQMTARVPADVKIAFDQSVWFRLNSARLHLFDSVTERAIH
jgi:multiple sugar transport system ATP-binding protein